MRFALCTVSLFVSLLSAELTLARWNGTSLVAIFVSEKPFNTSSGLELLKVMTAYSNAMVLEKIEAVRFDGGDEIRTG